MNRKPLFFWLIILPDIALLYLSLYLAVYIRYPGGFTPQLWLSHFKAFSAIYALWLLVFFIHGLFEVSSLRRYAALFINLISAMAVNLLSAVVYFYFQPNLILTPRRFLLVNTALAFVLILVWHLLVKYFFKNRVKENIYLFSFSRELNELEEEIKRHDYLGFNFMGHLNELSLATAEIGRDINIILPDNLQAKPEVLSKFYQMRTKGIKFYNHKDFYEKLLRRVYLSQLNETWFLENINYTQKRFYNLVKRFLDLVAGVFTTVIFAVTYPFVALVIKLESKGPVLFVQERVGQGNKIFKIIKYRTMDSITYTDWTQVNDSRITKVGKILRKIRIDELPQCINLLKGEVSLVGPRPERPHLVDDLCKQVPFYNERHLVKPGITGWAQLNIYAGSVEESRTKLQYDLYYIKHRGFMFDLEIILKTIYYVFAWKGR